MASRAGRGSEPRRPVSSLAALGRGFERCYGFLGGGTNQWYPDLTEDNHSVPQPRSPDEGYHLSEDLADKAITFVLDAHASAPDKPVLPLLRSGELIEDDEAGIARLMAEQQEARPRAGPSAARRARRRRRRARTCVEHRPAGSRRGRSSGPRARSRRRGLSRAGGDRGPG